MAHYGLEGQYAGLCLVYSLLLAIMTYAMISQAVLTQHQPYRNGCGHRDSKHSSRWLRFANEIIDDSLWCIGTHLHTVTDVACWLAGVSECACDFDFYVLNSNAALRRLPIKVVTKACGKSGEQ
jgi:hypothetical protein